MYSYLSFEGRFYPRLKMYYFFGKINWGHIAESSKLNWLFSGCGFIKLKRGCTTVFSCY